MKNNDKFNRFMGEHPRTITKHIREPLKKPLLLDT